MPNPAYVIIPFFNNEKLTALQDYLKKRFVGGKGYEAIEWQDPSTFHITICYHTDIEDADLQKAVIKDFESFEIVAHRENHNGIEFFETDDGLALYANLGESEALRALQAAVYAGFPEAGLSPHSKPDDWTAHITMAYLPDDFEIPPTDYDPIPLMVEAISYNRDNYSPFVTVSATERKRHMKRNQRPLSTHILPALGQLREQLESAFASLVRLTKEQRASYDMWQLYDMAWEYLEMRYDYPYINGAYVDDDGGLYIEFTDNGKLYRLRVLMVNGTVAFGTPEQIVIDRVPVSELGRARVVRVQRVANNKLRGVAIGNTAVLNRIGVIDSTELYDNMERRFNEFMVTKPSEEELAYMDIRHFNSRFNTDAFTLGRVYQIWRYEHQLHIAFELDASSELGRVAEERLADGTWGISIEFLALEARDEVIGNVPITVYTDGKFLAASILEERDAASYYTFIESQETYRMAMNDDQLKKTVASWLGNEADAQAFLDAAQLPERQIEREGLITRDQAGTDPEDTDADDNTEDAPDEDAPGDEEEGDTEENVPLVLDELAMDELANRMKAHLGTLFQPINTRLDEVEQTVRSAATASQAAMEEVGGILSEMNTDIEALQRDDTEKFADVLKGQSREQRKTQEREQRIRKVSFRPTEERKAIDGKELPESPAPDKPDKKEGFGGAMRVKGAKQPENAGEDKEAAMGFGGAGAKRKTN